VSKFASTLITWQRRNGRRGLPWQGTRDPYRIWLSEVMLQQTQVAAVIPYYERFLRRFPSVHALAAADEDEVLRLWSGLGYYARGRNLLLAAREIEKLGKFPGSARDIAELPGVGRSTAAAIAAFAFGERAAILDGNVKRVLARRYGIEGWPGERAVETKLWALAERLLPERGIERYTQALMDLGATVCVKGTPACEACPLRKECIARKQGRIATIPAPRPRKALPSRSATWLVLRHRGDILLERRPSSGLWGGLWTFPEITGEDVAGHCLRVHGCEIDASRELEPLEHGFTHFRLRIRALLCDVRKAAPRAAAPGPLWIDVADALGAAVPVPVRKILQRLQPAPQTTAA
jgi:A/G-specific adenine glycosylase